MPRSIPTRRRASAALLAACGCCTLPFDAAAQTRRRRYCADNSVPAGDRWIPLSNWQNAIGSWITRDEEHMDEYFGPEGEIRVYLGSSDAFADGSNPSNAVIGLGDQMLQRYGNQRLDKVSAVLGHEKAHVFQMGISIDRMLDRVRGHRVKFVELHADYLAGSYFAWVSRRRTVDPSSLASMFFSIGDFHPGSDDHHGTYQERFVAFANGFNQNTGVRDVTTAATKGIVYVRSLI